MIFVLIVALLLPFGIYFTCRLLSRSKRTKSDHAMQTHLVYFDGKAHHIRKGE